MWPNNMAAQLAEIPCPPDSRMRGNSKARTTVRSQAKVLPREIEAAQIRAMPQQTGLLQMLARVQTAAPLETILVTGKFQKPTRRGTPARSEDPRAEPPLKQTVRGVRPVWELPDRAAEAAGGDRAMNKRKNI